RNYELISVVTKILSQNLPEVLLGGPIRWPIVVRQVKVGHAPIKRSPDHRPSGLEGIDATEALPQPKRYWRQYDPRLSTAPKLRSVIPLRVEHITHQHKSPSSCCTPLPRAGYPLPNNWERGALLAKQHP